MNWLPDDWGIAADTENGAFVPLRRGLGRVDSGGSLRANWFYDPSDHSNDLMIRMVPVLDSADRDAVIVVLRQGNQYFSQGIRARKLVDPESSWPQHRIRSVFRGES